MNSVGPGGKGFAFDGNRSAKFDRRVFICSRSPNLAHRNKPAPDFAAVHERTVIGDGDVRYTDALLNERFLARVERNGSAAGYQLQETKVEKELRAQNKTAGEEIRLAAK